MVYISSIFYGFFGGWFLALAFILNLALKGRPTGWTGVLYSIITLNHSAGLKWKSMFLTGFIFFWYLTYYSNNT